MAATTAHAVETETANLNVKVVIKATCAISANDVNFGEVDSTSTNVEAQGDLRVNCTSGTAYTIALDDGANADGNTRRMAKGSDYVTYELYKESGRTTRWDSDSNVGTGTEQTIQIYGKLGSANSPAGAYSDVVIATVSY